MLTRRANRVRGGPQVQATATATAQTVTRLEKIETTMMEPILSGDTGIHYVEKTITGYAWCCNACGLVWDRKWMAEQCGERKHRPTFDQVYHRAVMHQGKMVDSTYAITRQAIRCEPITLKI